MKHMYRITIGLLAVELIVVGCAHMPFGTGWVTLIDGETGFENWKREDGANWRANRASNLSSTRSILPEA